MKHKIWLMAAVLVLSSCHHAVSKENEKKAKGESFPDSSQALSKWVRANVADYWQFEKANNSLGSFADSVGVVVGDTHLANFAPEPARLKDGTVKMKYLDIDFDDAGRAPFAYDFLRLVISTKATKKQAKVKEMVKAYIAGLTGGPAVAPPSDLQTDLSLEGDDYTKRMSDDLDSKVTDTGFKFKPGKIEPYSGAVTLAMVQPLLPAGVRAMAIALRPVEDGGSAKALRLWIYGRDGAGLRRLFELKQYESTRLAAWGEQLPMKDWAEEVRSTFWPDIARGEYELITLADQGEFWIREKKLTLIDIPYSNEDKKAVTYVRNLANFDAYYLGQLHARQASAAPLAQRLRNPVDQGVFQAQVKLAAKEYLHSVVTRQF